MMLMEPHIRNPYGLTIRRYADILNDRLFKRILGAERNKEALIEILRLLIPERDITDIYYDRKKRKRSPFADGHDAIFDVECIDGDGARFYSTFPIQEQVPQVRNGQGIPHDRQYEYQPVYVVSLMAFHFHEEPDKLLYRYELCETGSGERMTDRLTFIFLEMDKVREEPGPEADVLRKLCWALMNMSTLQERPAALLEKVFMLIFEACELEGYKGEERTEIIDIMTTERDKRNIAYTYWAEGKEEGLAEGVKQGLRKGIAKGRKEGRQEGRREGRQEGRREAFRSMAKELSALGVDPAIVEKVANFTER